MTELEVLGLILIRRALLRFGHNMQYRQLKKMTKYKLASYVDSKVIFISFGA